MNVEETAQTETVEIETVEEVEVFKGSSDVPTTSQDDTGSYIFKQKKFLRI